MSLSDAETIKTINGWLFWFWTANQPVVIALYLLLPDNQFQNVMLLYLAVVSVWALQGQHATAWITGRVEVNQEDT